MSLEEEGDEPDIFDTMSSPKLQLNQVGGGGGGSDGRWEGRGGSCISDCLDSSIGLSHSGCLKVLVCRSGLVG